jgi:hypothetical protein
VVKVASKLSKLGASGFLLTLLLIHHLFLVVSLERLTNLFILAFNVLKVLFTSVEVMLILARVKATIAETFRFKCTYNF